MEGRLVIALELLTYGGDALHWYLLKLSQAVWRGDGMI